MTGVTPEIAARRELRHEIRDRNRQSVRLGPESFAPAVPDAETAAIAKTADALGEERA